MFRRSSLPAALARTVLLAMLALSLALQPVLAAIGETHELSHADAMQASGHVLDQADLKGHDFKGDGLKGHDLDKHVIGADSQDHPNPPNGEEDGGSLWHAVLQFAHCCGQSPVTLTFANVTVPMASASSVMPDAVSALRLSAPVFEPQRPPIL